MTKTALVYTPLYLGHETGSHPENPGRLLAIMSHLDREGLLVDRPIFEPEAAPFEAIAADVPAEWLQKLAERTLTDEEKAKVEALGGWEKMINKAGYTWRGLPKSETENLTEAKAVALATAHTSLIRRPLIEHADGTVTVGFTNGVKALF